MVHSSPTVSPFFGTQQQQPLQPLQQPQQQPQQQHPKRRSLDAHSPRPPTPPRESPRSKKVILLSKEPFLATDGSIIIAADAASSVSSREASPPDTIKPKKRVLWSPWTKYHKPDVPLTSTPIRSLIDPKSLKGILKPSPAPLFFGGDSPLGRPIAAHTFMSFAAMLESIIQALGSSERSTKLDTYITFSNTLKAYDDIPDMKAMEEKLPALCAFIRRDLDAKLEESGNTDSQLIQQAIKFLVILVWTPRLVEAMDDTNAAFFLENAISRIEDATTPKVVVNHNLHLLAQQKFPPRIVTAERANRIITALETLDERVTGKSITKERIDIYYKLLFQAKVVMLTRVNDWMDNLFGGLLSSVSEVRNRALICVAEVSRVLGREKSLPKTLTNIFSRIVKGKRMFDSIKERLEQFIKDGEGIFVARMWGIVLLLVKSIGEHWEFFTPWLRIIEGCFNVSDKDVKVEAQLAWSKLIYAVNVGPNTTRKLLGLLCKPLEQYLDPKNGHSNTKKPRKAALANVSVLLYYGFRPNAASKQLSEIWDVVVVGLVEQMALSSKDEVAEGVAILSAIFDNKQTLWAETRVLAPPPMSPEDLPRLDPKWVRSNSALVLRTLEVALRRGHWGSEEADRGVRSLWKKFTTTLADAGSKEIKVSAELMEAVAHAFNTFQRIWTVGPSALNGAKDVPVPTEPVSFIKKFAFLVQTALESLGTFAFTEKQLAYDEQSKFSPAATPTHKYSSGTNPVVLHPPILHMMSLFLHPSAEIHADEEYYDCVRGILLRCVASQDSRRKKLALLAACAGLLPHRDARELDRGMWQILGQLVRRCLPLSARAAAGGSGSAQAEYRDVVKVLEWGCRYELPGWPRVFDEFCEAVGKEQGEGAVTAVCVEPLAEVLRHQILEKDNTASMRKGAILVRKVAWVKGKVDNPVKAPFGAGRRTSGVDSFEKLYDLVDHLLRRSYTLCTEGLPMTDTIALVTSVGDLIARCPAGSLLGLLRKTQEGLGIWITDPQTLAPKGSDNAQKTLALCVKVTDALSRLPLHDGKVLDALQVVVTSLLQSKRKQVVNVAVAVWNKTFGTQPALYYPRTVRVALKLLRPIADLSLPTFPETVEEDPVGTPPQFSESQEVSGGGGGGVGGGELVTAWSVTPSRLASPFEGHGGSPGVVKETPMLAAGRRGMLPKKAVGRLKHMDSQIEFAPIEVEDGEMDSQVLTEHQKEVRERQGGGLVFSGLELAGKGKGKGKERMVEGEVSRAESVGLGDEVRVGSGLDDARVVETQTEPNETASFISGMSNESSNPQFLLTKADEGPSVVRKSIESFKMPSPSREDWEEDDEDLVMTGTTPTPADTTPEDDSILLSDPPSMEEDDFVDAPDHIQSEVEDSPASRRNVKAGTMKIRVEISPPAPEKEARATSSEQEVIESAESSPGAQIIDEARASHGLPATPKSERGKKRVKRASGAAMAALGALSPDILGTIVVSGESPGKSPYRTRSVRLSQEKAAEATPSKRSKSKLAQETMADEEAMERTPSKGAGAMEVMEEATPSRRSRSKQPHKSPAGGPAKWAKVSPPRTRSSAKKSVTEAPQFPALEPALRKRKFLSVDDSPTPNNESRQSSIENVASPTPKRRRAGKATPKKRAVSSFTEDVPADPDISFIGETQLSFGSSIPDSQFPENDQDELVGPTPYAGTRAGIFDIAEKQEASKDADVGHEPEVEVESTPSRRRRGGRRSLPVDRGLGRTRIARAGKKAEVVEVVEEKTESEVEEEAVSDIMDIEEGPEAGVDTTQESEEVVISGVQAMGNLRKALETLGVTELTPGECREMEDLIFNAFAKLRQRGHHVASE